MLACARLQFKELKRRAKSHPGTIHEKTWEAFREVVTTVIGSSDVALHPMRALRGELHPVMRQKFGRFRIFYIVSEHARKAIVLFIGYRRQGDADDAYDEIAQLLRGPEFDLLFSELNLTKPTP